MSCAALKCLQRSRINLKKKKIKTKTSQSRLQLLTSLPMFNTSCHDFCIYIFEGYNHDISVFWKKKRSKNLIFFIVYCTLKQLTLDISIYVSSKLGYKGCIYVGKKSWSARLGMEGLQGLNYSGPEVQNTSTEKRHDNNWKGKYMQVPGIDANQMNIQRVCSTGWKSCVSSWFWNTSAVTGFKLVLSHQRIIWSEASENSLKKSRREQKSGTMC